jgi:hypothetical protein
MVKRAAKGATKAPTTTQVKGVPAAPGAAAVTAPKPVISKQQRRDLQVQRAAEKAAAHRGVELSWGASFMLFRVLVSVPLAVGLTASSMWQRCSSSVIGRVADSYCHRYDREMGFSGGEEEDNRARMDPRVARADQLITDQGLGKNESHHQRVMKWSIFERYCLERHPTDPWTMWLQGLAVSGDEDPGLEQLQHRRQNEERQSFRAPPVSLVTTFMMYLH